MYKVGIYLRLSSEDKNKNNKDDDSESIKNQRNLLIQYINSHPEFILIDEYCDEDISGAGTYRPEFERLINDCQNHKIDIVLCKSQSRFSRDMEIVEKYLNNKFIEWNIRFISLSDNADTNNLGNKKSIQINALVNEWYLEDISNNIRSAFLSKMKQGEFISPFAPYGYKISSDKNKLIVDNNTSSIIKKIYSLYLSGYGFESIVKHLNSHNIPSPSYYKYLNGCKLNIISKKPRNKILWNTTSVKAILKNEVYIGNLVQGKRTTVSYKNHKIIKKNKLDWIRKENTHEAIIDADDFKKVQERLKARTRIMKKTGKIHLLSGLVFCDICKCKMRLKRSNKYKYLACNNCHCNSLRYDILSKLILIEIKKKESLDRSVIDNYIKSIYVDMYKKEIKIVFNKAKSCFN